MNESCLTNAVNFTIRAVLKIANFPGLWLHYKYDLELTEIVIEEYINSPTSVPVCGFSHNNVAFLTQQNKCVAFSIGSNKAQ